MKATANKFVKLQANGKADVQNWKLAGQGLIT